MYENNCKVGQYFNVDYFQFIRTTVVKFKILSYFKYLDSLPPSQQTNEILSPPQILPTPQNNDYEKVSSSIWGKYPIGGTKIRNNYGVIQDGTERYDF